MTESAITPSPSSARTEPEVLLCGSSLAHFSCPEWDGWIATLLQGGAAHLVLSETAADDAEKAALTTRFPGASFLDPSALPARTARAVLCFGTPRPAFAAPSGTEAIGTATRGGYPGDTFVREALDAGATHFITDRLPDEIDSSTAGDAEAFAAWLDRFLFVPPCSPVPARLSPENRHAILVIADADRPNADPVFAVLDCFGEPQSRRLVPAAALADLPDADLATALADAAAIGFFSEDPQLAHRIALAAETLKIPFRPALRSTASPLRFCSGLRPSPGASAAAPREFGPIRRTAAEIAALEQSAQQPAIAPEETISTTPASLAAHIAAHLGITGPTDAGPPLWAAHPGWRQWRERAQETPIACRIPDHPLATRLSHPGVPDLLEQLLLDWPTEAAGRLWFESLICIGNPTSAAVARAFVASIADWDAICGKVFSAMGSLPGSPPDLRGPWAATLSELAAADHHFAERHGLPLKVIDWFDRDAAGNPPGGRFRLERAVAHARWGEWSTAAALASACETEDPGLPGAVARTVQARLEALHFHFLLPSEAQSLAPMLADIRETARKAEKRDPENIETVITARILDIYCGDHRQTLENLETAMRSRAWPASAAARLALHLLLAGALDAGQAAAAWILRREEEIQAPFDLLMAAAVLALAGRIEDADRFDSHYARLHPDDALATNPFALQTRAFAFAAHRDEVAAREAFARAVALRPSIALNRPALDLAIGRLIDNPAFSFATERPS